MKIALGTVQFGVQYGIANQTGQVQPDQIQSMLKLAWDNGIDTLDTAINYGESEQRLGQAGVQHFNVVTKLPEYRPGNGPVKDWVEVQIQQSLQRLGKKQLYALMLHRSDQLLEPIGDELYSALQSAKQNDLVKKAGVSVYSPQQLAAIVSRFPPDIVQAPLSLMDRRLITSGWLQRLKSTGVEIHVRSSFLQGLLLMPEQKIPERFAPWSGLFRQWFDWIETHQVTPLQACLAFVSQLPEVDKVVTGADNSAQLQQIVSAANTMIEHEFPDISCTDEKLINPLSWLS